MGELGIRYQHPEIEQLDRDGIKAIQRRKLAAMGERLCADTAWREHLAGAGIKAEDFAAKDILPALPTIEKADMRARYPFPMLGVEPARVARFFATSGTTGLPVLIGMTRNDIDVLQANQMMRIYAAIGLRPDDRVFQGFAGGMWIGGGTLDNGLSAYGPTMFAIGPGRGELVVQWLRDLAPTAFFTSLLWLNRLAEIAAEQGIDPKRDWQIRRCLYGGQRIAKNVQDEVEAAMPDGFTAHDTYGSSESGGPVVAVPCSYAHDRDEMHLINEDTVLTEIVDPETLAPVGPGEVGEILITTLDKEASPALRWRTHDLVQLSSKPYDCPCGRHGLPLISRIIGRSDDMLKVRGVIVYPSQIEDIITGTEGTVKEAWQIYIDRASGRLEELEIAFERRRDARESDSDLTEQIRREIAARLGMRVRIRCHDEGALPRYEGKAQRVIVRDAASP